MKATYITPKTVVHKIAPATIICESINSNNVYGKANASTFAASREDSSWDEDE
jgi:hypothetical protein